MACATPRPTRRLNPVTDECEEDCWQAVEEGLARKRKEVVQFRDAHSRFECKYIINPLLVEEVRSFIRPFMQPDTYAASHPVYTYPVCTLYLDSPDLQLYSQVLAGEKNRFKLRVRTYSDDPETPVFFEIKKRMNQIVIKRRAKVDRDAARELLTKESSSVPVGLADKLMPDLDEFTSYKLLISAKPVLRVAYMREAYESRTGEPVRVTFDTRLRHAVTFDDTLSHTEGEWLETPTEGVILEVKFTDRFPTWARDMAELFQLRQRAVPKYVMSVNRVLYGSRTRTVSLAGFTLPPQRYQDIIHD